MRLGYDLTIEQAQKLVMTPELIQAIQILQFNTQELEAYVDEQVLVNPILEIDPQPQEPETTQSKRTKAGESEFDWAEHFKEREYDDISYKQWQYRQKQDTAE